MSELERDDRTETLSSSLSSLLSSTDSCFRVSSPPSESLQAPPPFSWSLWVAASSSLSVLAASSRSLRAELVLLEGRDVLRPAVDEARLALSSRDDPPRELSCRLLSSLASLLACDPSSLASDPSSSAVALLLCVLGNAGPSASDSCCDRPSELRREPRLLPLLRRLVLLPPSDSPSRDLADPPPPPPPLVLPSSELCREARLLLVLVLLSSASSLGALRLLPSTDSCAAVTLLRALLLSSARSSVSAPESEPDPSCLPREEAREDSADDMRVDFCVYLLSRSPPSFFSDPPTRSVGQQAVATCPRPVCISLSGLMVTRGEISWSFYCYCSCSQSYLNYYRRHHF